MSYPSCVPVPLVGVEARLSTWLLLAPQGKELPLLKPPLQQRPERQRGEANSCPLLGSLGTLQGKQHNTLPGIGVGHHLLSVQLAASALPAPLSMASSFRSLPLHASFHPVPPRSLQTQNPEEGHLPTQTAPAWAICRAPTSTDGRRSVLPLMCEGVSAFPQGREGVTMTSNF